MTTYLCVKTCGLFRQGRKYSFAKPTAMAISAARGGFLKPLADGGVVQKAPQVPGEDGTPALVIPKKRGRPKKVQAVQEEVD